MTDENQIVKGYTFRLDENIIQEIDRIAVRETKRTGYKLDRSQIVRKALVDLIEDYDTSFPYTLAEAEEKATSGDSISFERKKDL